MILAVAGACWAARWGRRPAGSVAAAVAGTCKVVPTFTRNGLSIPLTRCQLSQAHPVLAGNAIERLAGLMVWRPSQPAAVTAGAEGVAVGAGGVSRRGRRRGCDGAGLKARRRHRHLGNGHQRDGGSATRLAPCLPGQCAGRQHDLLARLEARPMVQTVGLDKIGEGHAVAFGNAIERIPRLDLDGVTRRGRAHAWRPRAPGAPSRRARARPRAPAFGVGVRGNSGVILRRRSVLGHERRQGGHLRLPVAGAGEPLALVAITIDRGRRGSHGADAALWGAGGHIEI